MYISHQLSTCRHHTLVHNGLWNVPDIIPTGSLVIDTIRHQGNYYLLAQIKNIKGALRKLPGLNAESVLIKLRSIFLYELKEIETSGIGISDGSIHLTHPLIRNFLTEQAGIDKFVTCDAHPLVCNLCVTCEL